MCLNHLIYWNQMIFGTPPPPPPPLTQECDWVRLDL
jgi:hypothetical protein